MTELSELIWQLLHESTIETAALNKAIADLEQMGIKQLGRNIAPQRAYIQQGYMGIMAFSPFTPIHYLATSGASYCLVLTFYSESGCKVGLLTHLDSSHEQYAEDYLHSFCERFIAEIHNTWPKSSLADNTDGCQEQAAASSAAITLIATLVCSKDNQRGRQEQPLTSAWRQALQHYRGNSELRVLYSCAANIDVLLDVQTGVVQIYEESKITDKAASIVTAKSRDILNHPGWLRLCEVGEIENTPSDDGLRYLEQLTATHSGQVAEVSLPKNAEHADFREHIKNLHKVTFIDYYEAIVAKVNLAAENEPFTQSLWLIEASIEWLYSHIAISSGFQDTLRQFCISANQLTKQIERFTCSLISEERLYQAIQDLALPANVQNADLAAATDQLRNNLRCLLQLMIKTRYIYKSKKLNRLLKDLLHGSRIIFIPFKPQQTIDHVSTLIQEKLVEELAIIHIIQLVPDAWCMLYIKPESSGKHIVQYYGSSLSESIINMFISHLGITPEQLYQTIHEGNPYYISIWLTESAKHLAYGEAPPAIVNYQELLIQQQIRYQVLKQQDKTQLLHKEHSAHLFRPASSSSTEASSSNLTCLKR